MKPRKLSEIAGATGGRLSGEDVVVDSVAIDSRLAGPGSLFVALSGNVVDGHRFVGDALERGATGAIVRADFEGDLAGPAVEVADTQKALGVLAADHRSSSQFKVVGITGSTGKTMTKDLVAAVASIRYSVQASPGSYNNEIGLPLTLLGTADATEVVVAEMGSRGLGHISLLCEIASPDIGIITNVGVAHMELFGSAQNIADAKAELVEALETSGTAVIPADDQVAVKFAARTRARSILFGTGAGADVRAESISLTDDGMARFTLIANGERELVELSVPGEHMVSNALAASAAGVALGLSATEIAAGLRDAKVSAWRMETTTSPSGVRVINDAYNANPTSMAAAIKAARWIARKTRLAAVLGTMRELGSISLQEHEKIGELVARLGVERLITVGTEAEPIALAAVREGLEPENSAAYELTEEALADVQNWVRPGDVVLLKGSRAVGLEKLAEAIK